MDVSTSDRLPTFEYIEGMMDGRTVPDGLDEVTADLLSDQCPWHIRIESATYGLVRLLEGSMIRQILDCLSTLDCMNARMRHPPNPGIRHRFPVMAIKGAVVNSVIHRDYGVGSDTVITLHGDFMTVESPGTLWFPDGWNKRIWSDPRNPGIRTFLVDIGMARLNGTGLHTIQKSYIRSGYMPRMIARDDSFMVILPAIDTIGDTMDIKRRKVVGYLSENHGATLRDVSDILMTSLNHTKRILRRMQDDGDVFSTGCRMDRMFFLNDVNRGC